MAWFDLAGGGKKKVRYLSEEVVDGRSKEMVAGGGDGEEMRSETRK